MTNDIRKNIMLIESIILDESFKDAQIKFSTTANPDEVKSYIEKFKELSKRNIIKGQDKDIGFWIKGDWGSFKKFVDSNSAVTTNRQTKAVQKKDSIVVYNDDNKQVVIPLTKEASIQYGKNTRWCTAASESENYFISYFYANKVVLFYVLFKDGNKYACAFHPEQADTIECFDQQDTSMYFDEFEEATGISKKDIQNWYSSNKTKIEGSRDLNKCSEEVQLDAVTHYGTAIEYIDNPSEEVQLAAVTKNGYAIQFIDNPSEEVQLAAVAKDGYVIQFIDNPNEEVQLAAVNKDCFAIKNIDNPTEKAQLAAVNKYGEAIKHIANPTEKVQLAAIAQDRYSIINIDNPTEKVQLDVVKKYGRAIKYIIDKGITPSEEVQLAAVKETGSAIVYMANPSEQVQLAAVTTDSDVIEYIANPTEKVKALHQKLWGQ